MLIINSMYLINLHFWTYLKLCAQNCRFFKIHSGKFQKELHIQSKKRPNIKVWQNAPVTYKNFGIILSIVDYFSQTQTCRKGDIITFLQDVYKHSQSMSDRTFKDCTIKLA